MLYLLDSITVSCDGLKKVLDGNFADTSLGRTLDSIMGLATALANGDMNAVIENPLGGSLAEDVLGAADKLTGELKDSLGAYMNQNLPPELLEGNYSNLVSDVLGNEQTPSPQQATSAEFQSNWLSNLS